MPLLRNFLIAIAATAAQADVRGFLQVHNATSAVVTQELGEDVKVGDYDAVMAETEDNSDDVDEDETAEEEGSAFSESEVEALKSEKGDESVKDDNNKSAISFVQVQENSLFERVWMVCEVPKPQPPTAGEIASGMTTAEPTKCTDEMSYKDLCCAGFEKEKFKKSGLLGLDSTKYLTTAPTQAGKVIKVCTQSSNGMALMDQAKSDAAAMPVECTKVDITEAQLRGESDGLQPGEIVLRERLLFFANQQIPMSRVPTCKEAYPNQQKCPGGKTPTTVSEAWLAKKFNLLSLKKSVVANIINDEEGDAGSDDLRFGFGGMMTSGSFMMMSSGFR